MLNKEVILIDARHYLDRLNLQYIVDIMCSNEYALPRWTRSDANHCSHLYKRWLLLLKMNSTMIQSFVPTREIDEFWHNHILHTQNYFTDCFSIFGFYLHHVPSSPEDNVNTLTSNYQKTKEYYFEAFGESL